MALACRLAGLSSDYASVIPAGRIRIMQIWKSMDTKCQTITAASLKMVVTWCPRTYIGLRPYMVNVYIKERINDQITIYAGGSPVTPRI